MVAVTGLLEVFTALKPAMLPTPLAPIPIEVLELVHAKLAPEVGLVKLVAATAALLHTVMLAGTLTVGVGLTVMT